MRCYILSVVLIVVCFLTSCSSSSSDTPDADIADQPTVAEQPAAQLEINNPIAEPVESKWRQVDRLEALSGRAIDNGFVSGNRALIGGAASIDDFSGSVEVLERDSAGDWQRLATLVPADIDNLDLFGSSMSLSGDTAFIVSSGDDDVESLLGAAYIFERDNDGEWSETAKLLPDAGAGIKAVSVQGNRALVGGSNFGRAYSGLAYIYERELNGIWVRVATLRPSDVEGFDLLGFIGDGVSLSGNRALISSPRDDQNGNASGAVYVFELENDGVWREQAKLMASDGSEDDYFGVSVGLSEDVAIISQLNVFREDTTAGSLYVFERNNLDEWVEVARLTSADSAVGDGFGRSVALDGNRAMAGAAFDTTNDAGVVYVFERDANGQWNEASRLTNGVRSDLFGWSVSLSGNNAIFGAPSAANSQQGDGAAFIFELTN